MSKRALSLIEYGPVTKPLKLCVRKQDKVETEDIVR